jgi:acetoin utilization deacetylase AcuC-like enzyme
VTIFFTHPACLRHNPGAGHPDSPARLLAVLEALRDPSLAALQWREAAPATGADLCTVHTAQHVERVFAAIPEQGLWNLDPDTIVAPGSGAAALYAAGAGLGAVDAVLTGADANAFCAVRPGGHHARRDRTGGFCLFNNIALAAERARRCFKLARVAIVDFDLHHGDGTQAIFRDDPAVFVASVHQWPFDPGTGDPEERGPHNTILNIPLSAGDGGKEFRGAVAGRLLPALEEFRPELVLVSAGFDAHKADPLGSLYLDESDYFWLAQALRATAETCCQGRLVAVLEGGYALAALGASCAAFVGALLQANSRS